MRRIALASTLLLVAGATGCALVSGLDGIGTCQGACDDAAIGADASADAPPDGAAADSGPSDGGIGDSAPLPDSGPPANCTSPAGACVASLPQSWTLLSTGMSCPNNFTTQALVSNPQASNGSCACSACTVSNPGCSSTVSWSSGNGNCQNDSGQITTGSCKNITQGTNLKLTAQPTGQCGATPSGKPGQLTTSSFIACTPPPACQEDLCSGKLGLPVCVVRSGYYDTCPQGFNKRTFVGASASASCACDCQNTSTCNITGAVYPQANCGGGGAAIINDNGQCNAVSAASVTLAVSLGTTSCQASASSQTSMTSGQTVCCK